MDGEWWLEDLNSANGTFVDDQKISGPVPLGPGPGGTIWAGPPLIGPALIGSAPIGPAL